MSGLAKFTVNSYRPKKAVAAYFSSEKLLSSGFEGSYTVSVD